MDGEAYFVIGADVVFLADDDEPYEGVIFSSKKDDDGMIVYWIQNDKFSADVREDRIIGEILYLNDKEEDLEKEI